LGRSTGGFTTVGKSKEGSGVGSSFGGGANSGVIDSITTSVAGGSVVSAGLCALLTNIIGKIMQINEITPISASFQDFIMLKSLLSGMYYNIFETKSQV
jgi:hypothetical protein